MSKMSNQFKGYCYGNKQNYIILNRIGFQTSLAPKDRFVRPTVSYDNAELEEWRDNVVVWVEQLIKNIEEDHFPHNETSCDKFGGCPYRKICQVAPEARQYYQDTFFELKPPHDSYEEDEE